VWWAQITAGDCRGCCMTFLSFSLVCVSQRETGACGRRLVVWGRAEWKIFRRFGRFLSLPQFRCEKERERRGAGGRRLYGSLHENWVGEWESGGTSDWL